MKKIPMMFLIVLLPIFVLAEIPSSDTKMLNVDGNEYAIADVKGEKGTLVIFTCNHCPWVKAWESRLASIGNDYMKKGFGVIAINPNNPAKYAEDSYEEMKKRATQLGLKYAYVVDSTSEVARSFGASKTPEVFLYNSEDALVYHGAVDDNAQDEGAVKKHFLIDALDATLSGKEPADTETKALGCGIKFR